MIIFEGQEYSEIIKFDCTVINLRTAKGRGYFTALPISSKKYRDEQIKTGGTLGEIGLKAKVEIIKILYFIKFKITDDWGKTHRIYISKDMKKEIAAAKESAKQEGLLC